MLVLSRKQGERICIGEGIELQVVAIHGGRVRLGITCPGHIRILRTELRSASDCRGTASAEKLSKRIARCKRRLNDPQNGRHQSFGQAVVTE